MHEDICYEYVIGKLDGIKVINNLTVRGGDYSGLYGWVQCNHRGPYERETGVSGSEKEM